MLSLNSKSGLTIGQTILRILGVRRFSFVLSVDNTLSVELIGYAGMPNVSFVRLHIREMKWNNTHSYPRTSLHYSIIKEGDLIVYNIDLNSGRWGICILSTPLVVANEAN